MIAELQCLVIDCQAPAELAEFYRSVLGGEVDRPDGRWALGEAWSTLHTPGGLVLCFQGVADHRPPTWPSSERPQQSHLDFAVGDLDAAGERVVALGARLLDAGGGSRSWRVYADPAGHPFCLVRH
ncbi:VOC family protein [Streptomyces sp. NPDC058128]|uniref:VOC family protein n=1 Tax=unclassified Streptomyces TaxID=2593676 RepID=UPI001E37B848|nr:VOC family protein [Streptomyces sp. MBT42]MCD2465239.1 VOC family protein [Streptomyces sp. MBT42]